MNINIVSAGAGPQIMTIKAFETASGAIVERSHILSFDFMRELAATIKYRQEDTNHWVAKEMWKDGKISEKTNKHQEFPSVLRGAEEGFKTLKVVKFKASLPLELVAQEKSKGMYDILQGLYEVEIEDYDEEGTENASDSAVKGVYPDDYWSSEILWEVDLED